MTSHYLFIYLSQFHFYRQKTKDYQVNLMHAFSNDILFHGNIPPPPAPHFGFFILPFYRQS